MLTVHLKILLIRKNSSRFLIASNFDKSVFSARAFEIKVSSFCLASSMIKRLVSAKSEVKMKKISMNRCTHLFSNFDPRSLDAIKRKLWNLILGARHSVPYILLFTIEDAESKLYNCPFI